MFLTAQSLGHLRSPANCEQCMSQHMAPSVSHAKPLVVTLRRLSWRMASTTDKHSSVGCHWYSMPGVCAASVISMLCFSHCQTCHSNGVTTHHFGREMPEGKVGAGMEGRSHTGMSFMSLCLHSLPALCGTTRKWSVLPGPLQIRSNRRQVPRARQGRWDPKGAALACLFLVPRVFPLQYHPNRGGAAMQRMPGIHSIPVTWPHGSQRGGTSLPHDQFRQT